MTRQLGYLAVLSAVLLLLTGCQGGGQAGATMTPATSRPAGQPQAALEAFARSVLGHQVRVVSTGGMASVLELPDPIRLQVEGTLDMAAELYAGQLADGTAIVGAGPGVSAGDLDLSIRWSSLGVFSFKSRAAMPGSPEDALALLQETFPALAALSYAPSQVRQGYAFWAQSNEPAVDPRTGQASATEQDVLLGVWAQPTTGIWVYAVVGRGEFASGVGQ